MLPYKKTEKKLRPVIYTDIRKLHWPDIADEDTEKFQD
jgi:hypothetical protein